MIKVSYNKNKDSFFVWIDDSISKILEVGKYFVVDVRGNKTTISKDVYDRIVCFVRSNNIRSIKIIDRRIPCIIENENEYEEEMSICR